MLTSAPSLMASPNRSASTVHSRASAAQHNAAARVHADPMEGVLAQVDTDRGNSLCGGVVCHGMPPCLRGSPALPCSAREHGRSMPLDFPARLKELAKAEARGKLIEIWFADEARVGQKNKITRRWAKRGTRPSAPKDQRTQSAYIFGAI